MNGRSRWALLALKEHGRVRDRGREALVGVVRADASLGEGRSVAGHLRRSGREALVPVVKSADLGQFDDLAHAGRADLPRVGRVLAERQMGSRPVVVREVRLQDAWLEG